MLSTFDARHARHRARRATGLWRCGQRSRQLDQRGHPLSSPHPALPHARDAEPQRAEHAAVQLLQSRSPARTGRSRRSPLAVRRLFSNMADTFAAISRDPRRAAGLDLRGVPADIEARSARSSSRRPSSPTSPTSRRVAPGARRPRSLPPIDQALVTGTRVLAASVKLSDRLGDVFAALDDLAENPQTLLAIRDLDTAVTWPARESSSSPRSRPSATSPSTSSTRSASTCPCPPAAAATRSACSLSSPPRPR